MSGREGGGSRYDETSPLARQIVRVGRYRLDELIGRGGFGLVYKGYDEQIDRPVAIKTLRPEVLEDLASNGETLQRFAVEARSAARCLHPNIVAVFDYLEDNGAPFIIMEYVPAGTLDDVIRSGVRLPIGQVAAITEQVLLALDHAHGKGVIHRDVKPSNILCHSAASIKVADFGTARIEALNLTRAGRLEPIGTPNYMAPERFLGRPADVRGEVYSVGVVLYQLLSGQRPFIASDYSELMNKVLHDSPPPLHLSRPDLWPELDEVAQKALARNPEDRFQTPMEFLDALNSCLAAGTINQAPPLDLTVCATIMAKTSENPASSSPRLSQSMAERLKPETLIALERLLASRIGPMAKILVRRVAAEATDVERFLAALAEPLGSSAETASFLKQAESMFLADNGVVAAQLIGAVRRDEIETVTAAILPIMGPIARHLVARTASAAVGSDDFYERLAKELPTPRDRAMLLSLQAKLRPGQSH
jgi:serine/threonine protein kinase